MYYLDTSVLLAFTLMKNREHERHQAASALFGLIETSVIKGVTSFYALHELLIIALSNTEPDWETGSELARQAFQTIFGTRLLYVPLPRREDKVIKARLFASLRDATDLPHAVAAHIAGCDTIVAYDEHFQDVGPRLVYRTPEEVLAELAQRNMREATV